MDRELNDRLENYSPNGWTDDNQYLQASVFEKYSSVSPTATTDSPALFAGINVPCYMGRVAALHYGGCSNRNELFFLSKCLQNYVKLSANLIVYH